jgi:DNA-binding transcriptional LysR family regulator
MTKRLPDLEAWAIFAKVAELGSFNRAAADLGLSNPTVSKAIARLETRLGFSLFARTSRRLSLTEAGRNSLHRASRMLDEGWALEEEAGEQASVPRGLVRISAPLSFGAAYLGATLPSLMEAFPEIVLDFQLSDRKVDLIAEGFDLALRIASLEDSSLLARRLSTVRILLVGSPAYFERHGRPQRPADLVAHCALAYSGSAIKGNWKFSHAKHGEEEVEPPIRIWSDNVDMLNAPLIAGHGIALQPEFLIWKELRAGALEVAMPDWTVPPLGLHLLTPPSPRRPLRVQTVIEHLTRELSNPQWISHA